MNLKVPSVRKSCFQLNFAPHLVLYKVQSHSLFELKPDFEENNQKKTKSDADVKKIKKKQYKHTNKKKPRRVFLEK